jgi:hypothetical protein
MVHHNSTIVPLAQLAPLAPQKHNKAPLSILLYMKMLIHVSMSKYHHWTLEEEATVLKRRKDKIDANKVSKKSMYYLPF